MGTISKVERHLTHITVPHESFSLASESNTRLKSLLEMWEQWKPIPTVLTDLIVAYASRDTHFSYMDSSQNHPWVTIEIEDSQAIRWQCWHPLMFCRQIPVWSINGLALSNAVLDFECKFGPVSLPSPLHFRQLGKLIVGGEFLFHLFFVGDGHISCSKFDPIRKEWCDITMPLTKPTLYSFALVALSDKIYCFGSHWSTSNNQVYDTRTDSWSFIASLPQNLPGAVAVVLPDSRTIAVMGGKLEFTGIWTDYVFLYDTVEDKCSEASWTLPTRMAFFVAHVYNDLLFLSSQFGETTIYMMSFHSPGDWKMFTLQKKKK